VGGAFVVAFPDVEGGDAAAEVVGSEGHGGQFIERCGGNAGAAWVGAPS
jgi:hypothetical protein